MKRLRTGGEAPPGKSFVVVHRGVPACDDPVHGNRACDNDPGQQNERQCDEDSDKDVDGSSSHSIGKGNVITLLTVVLGNRAEKE
jgi:hypothetical protein